MQEQSLKSNTAADAQFEKFVEPQEACITIVILADTRQSGTNRLACLFTEFLRREGYSAVQGPALNIPQEWEPEKFLEDQKKVKIDIRTGTMPPMKFIEVPLGDALKEHHFNAALNTTPASVSKALDGVDLDLN